MQVIRSTKYVLDGFAKMDSVEISQEGYHISICGDGIQINERKVMDPPNGRGLEIVVCWGDSVSATIFVPNATSASLRHLEEGSYHALLKVGDQEFYIGTIRSPAKNLSLRSL